MASVKKRTNKDGTVSYLIRAFVEEKPGGRQDRKSMTWRPPDGMRPSAADKQAEKEAALFEELVRSGVISIDGKTRFSDYAAKWMRVADLEPKTRVQYEYLLTRINKAIGHIALEKIRASHLKEFYKNLREPGVKESGYAIATTLDKKRDGLKLTYVKLAELSGVSTATASVACRGHRVSVKSAKKISDALGADMTKLFNVARGKETLSETTVWHHHKLIRTILYGAKEDKAIQNNVAARLKGAPTQPDDEAAYLDEDDAIRFLEALLDEPDIRIKTALILDMFSGVRRGELCGFSWTDVGFFKSNVAVKKASQYVSGLGVIETTTKSKKSVREISVPPFVISVLEEYRLWWLDYKKSLGDAWKGGDRLFIQKDGKPLFPSTINYWMSKFIERNDLPHATPHTLRHTFASLQIASGVDLRTLQSRTGHAKATTLLNTYSHVIKSAQERAAKAMEDALLAGFAEEQKKAK